MAKTKLDYRADYKRLLSAREQSITTLQSLVGDECVGWVEEMDAFESDLGHIIRSVTQNVAVPFVENGEIETFFLPNEGLNPITFRPNVIYIPHIIFVPGMIFNLGGYRIGRGKGCYDKFLSLYPQCVKIGATKEPLLLDCDLPHEAYDIKMDYILTDMRLININI